MDPIRHSVYSRKLRRNFCEVAHFGSYLLNAVLYHLFDVLLVAAHSPTRPLTTGQADADSIMGAYSCHCGYNGFGIGPIVCGCGGSRGTIGCGINALTGNISV